MKFRTFIFSAFIALTSLSTHAAVIGITGNDFSFFQANKYLSQFGHSVVQISNTNSTNLDNLDVLIMGRMTGGNDNIKSFVSQGGMLITEWSSTIYAMELLGGKAKENYNSYYTNDSIVFSPEAISAGLSKDLGNLFSNTNSTEFFHDFESLGSGTIYGSRGTNGQTAIVGGKYGAGFIWANGFDWGDFTTDLGALLSFTLINNEINAKLPNSVPEPGSLALFGLALFGFMASRRRK